ncbi:MAG: DNA translocase FtsK [Muribaculum sp.]|nr:DNA translocase FtsK [Muribaculum sp.]
MDRYDNYNPEIPYTDTYGSNVGKQDLPAAPEPEKKISRKKGSRTVAPKMKKQQKSASSPTMHKADTSLSLSQKIKDFVQSSTTRWITGLIIGFFGIYLLISFISYMSDCFADQSIVNNAPIGYAHGISNKGGEGGARISEFLINQCFGLGSFVIILWLLAISLKLLVGKPRFKTVNFTIKCIVALVTVSLIVGLLTIGLNSTVNWGGYHGRYVNLAVIEFLGWWGAALLCILLIAIFVVICLRDVILWVNRVNARRREHKRLVEEEKARRLEEQRLVEEMRQVEQEDDVHAGMAHGAHEETNTADNTVSFNPEETSRLYDGVADIDEYDLSNGPLTRTADSLDNERPSAEHYSKEEVETTPAAEDSSESIESSSEYSIVDSGSDSDKAADSESTDTVKESTMDSSGVYNNQIISNGFESASADVAYTASQQKSREEGCDASANGVDTMVVNVNEITTVDKAVKIEDDPRDQRSKMYKFPPLEILREGNGIVPVNADEQIENKERIRKTLADFGIPIVSIEATVGPTVTLYEIRPDKGQKVQKIKNLVDDLSLSLSATGVRIIAPIPGKGTVGIEVANKNPQMVAMRTVIGSRNYQESRFKLPVALGCTINNDVYIADLAKMPHMLVAGATGQGKSVGLNVIIASLLYRKKPHELKFVMIDPKMVEFSLYAKIEKHYLAKMPGEEKAIITDMSKAVATLNSLVQEMEDRYLLLMDAECRKVEEYNEKFLNGMLDSSKGHRFMPYIVVIIDEFCDLIMTQGKEVEKPIARLAQKARAVGIHEIIATQRPSATVITGNIKANFLTRVAFKVSSGIDSKTILDTSGAQQLVGRGDMLINYNSEMIRVQCAFMDTPEVEALTDYVSRQPYGGGAYMLPEPRFSTDGESFEGGEMESGAIRDPKFYEIATFVVQTGYASTSNIQRKFEIGYNRAGKIMDQLESLGIVSPAQGGKPRSVLMSPGEAMEVIEHYRSI